MDQPNYLKGLNYQYGLLVAGQIIDITNLDEDDQEHAKYLFMQEFGWQEKLQDRKDVTVQLLAVEPDED